MVNQIYPTEFQLIRQILLIVMLSLDLSIISAIVSSKIYVNEMILILKKLISYFLIKIFLTPFPMVYIFRISFVLQEYALMLVTSTTETNFCYFNKVVDIINS